MTNPLQEYVRQGYALGFSFTPLNGKKPTLLDWPKLPRETCAQAVKWAAKGNVGLRTGKAAGGLLVVDLDTNKECYDAAAVKLLNLPRNTVTARTGGGGWHLYFRLPAGVALGCSVGSVKRRKGLAEAVDTRGDGGQVVYPGSVHPDTGKPYTWQPGHAPGQVEIAELPGHIINFLTGEAESPAFPPRSPAAGPDSTGTETGINAHNGSAGGPDRRGPAGTGPHNREAERAEKYAQAALAAEVAKVAAAAKGTRNHQLNESAFCLGQLVGGGVLTADTVRAALAACIPPQFQAQNLPTIDSGLTAGMQEPRGVPEPTHRPRGADAATRGADAAPGGFVPLGERDERGRLVLSTKRTLPTAGAYLEQFHTHKDGRTLHSYGGRLVTWVDNRYTEQEDGAARCRLQPWLHAAKQYGRDGVTMENFPANPSTVTAALETVRAAVHLPQGLDMPCWLSGDPQRVPAAEVLPGLSANLHIPTGEVFAATPDLFTFNALDYDYNPQAPTPNTWFKFLGELWPGDQESIDLLQEWFGYCLTPDTAQQKMLLVIGPKRCGKGTLARVLSRLIGQANVVGPTTGSLAGGFGLQPLLGKSLAIVSDARFSGPDIQTIVERLLCISGEDAITVDRKHLESVTVKLPTRFVFLSNEVPRMRDAAGALAARFKILSIEQSFYGREDPALTGKLLDELPGVLLWALQGWLRLHERGHFGTPESSTDKQALLHDLASPVAAFVRECCEVTPGGQVNLDAIYTAWCTWCERDNRKFVLTRQAFGRDLAAAVPGLRVRRNHTTGRFYDGVALLPEWAAQAETPAG